MNYTAKEAKRPDTLHAAGHRRLGSGFTKCGKEIGRRLASTAGFNRCKVCTLEAAKESATRPKIAGPVNTGSPACCPACGVELLLTEARA